MTVVRLGSVAPPTRLLQDASAPGQLTVSVGDTLVYTVVVSNGGPAQATGVALVDELSAVTPLVGVTASQGTCGESSRTAAECSIGALPAGTSATVRVSARATQAGIASSTATVSADQATVDAANLHASAKVAVTPLPVYDRSVNVEPLSGRVTYKLPGSSTYQPLTGVLNIPAQTEINAVAGTVSLTSARTAKGQLQKAAFAGGRFVVSYQPLERKGPKRRNLITVLRLSASLSCGSRSLSGADQGGKERNLWGNGKGNFRTVGRYAAATVRGTIWHTADTCRSTTVFVRRGRVEVFDFLLGRDFVVTAGHRHRALRH